MKLKSLFTIVVVSIGVGIVGLFPAAAQLSPSSPAPAEPAQNESAEHPSGKEVPNGLKQQRARPDAAVEFKSEGPRRTLPEQRSAEALRFHHNLLDRFQNTDSNGQVLLSFSSGGRVDLTLRSANGAEAPVAALKPHEK
ncbi:MAG TPA: hypothetical protein VFA47_02735 [Candidatus Manganitrophaceae bacterium]|nr:hypothetical protein [Candidatus Manganitrophaceae bacterium]